jgi:hypothetical protein
MSSAALPALLLLSLPVLALAQSRRGGPCGGATGLHCVDGNQCVDGRGRLDYTLFGDGAGAADGQLRCASLAGAGDGCGAERNVFCAPILAENRGPNAFPAGPTVPGVCEGGVCVRGKVGLKGDWCAAALGVTCAGAGEAGVCDEDRLFCEFVRGYPEDAYHCVTRAIDVGAVCPTGVSRSVNVKVFAWCEVGATCVHQNELVGGLCVKD